MLILSHETFVKMLTIWIVDVCHDWQTEIRPKCIDLMDALQQHKGAVSRLGTGALRILCLDLYKYHITNIN